MGSASGDDRRAGQVKDSSIAALSMERAEALADYDAIALNVRRVCATRAS